MLPTKKDAGVITVHNSDNKGEIVLYQPDQFMQLDVLGENEPVWLTQSQMISLFNRDKSVISRHIKIFC